MKALVIALLLCFVTAPAAHASFVDYKNKEISLKVVYYGPGLLEDNLRYIYAKTNPDAKGKIVQLSSETKHAQFYSYLPLSLGEIRGFKVKIHLYTVPAAADYAESRKLILKGADGVVFVADADPRRAKANTQSLDELNAHLAAHGTPAIPVVFQVNGTQKSGAVPFATVTKSLAVADHPVFEAIPSTGVGVFDTLKSISKLVLTELKKPADSDAKTPSK